MPLMAGASFVIARRLSTVRNSDAVVLEHGRIIERGTHDELIAWRVLQLYTGSRELEIGAFVIEAQLLLVGHLVV